VTHSSSSVPRVSIALSTFNGAAYLREQLDSLLAQTSADFEIVAVDDGSRDATPRVLDESAPRDARLRWSPNPGNLGPTRSFERAFAQCRGEFIAPCDQDDVWDACKLERLLDAIDGVDLAYCDSGYIDADGASLGKRVSDHRRMLEGRDPLPLLFSNSVSGHAMLVRRSLVQAAGPAPAGTYFDWWLALCAAGREGVRYVPEPLVRFRRHEDAYSPVGPTRRTGRDAAANAWLAQRHALMRGYARTGFRECEAAARLADAFDVALRGGARGAAMRMLWRYRDAAPAASRLRIVDQARLLLRAWKHLGRARCRAPGEA
jgi:glycosyltransferase involved in cell wall biosynthesis